MIRAAEFWTNSNLWKDAVAFSSVMSIFQCFSFKVGEEKS